MSMFVLRIHPPLHKPGRDLFDHAIALFAEAYADQSDREHAGLLTVFKEGRIKAGVDV
ncbi:MAG TPA: hypothetical protein VIX20_09720 [Ktedonobacteraceae bacterium]